MNFFGGWDVLTQTDRRRLEADTDEDREKKIRSL